MFSSGIAIGRRLLARAALLAFATWLLTNSASADCTPASANNITASCTGTTTNQGGGAPGTSAGTNGYGLGTETGITVNVANGATVTGTAPGSTGIAVGNSSVNLLGSSSSVTGADFGISAANVTNAGSITGTNLYGISSGTSVTVTNIEGASITGGAVGIIGSGIATVANSGRIVGSSTDGIASNSNVSVTNNAGGSIIGGFNGVAAGTNATVTNSGSITGTLSAGINASANITVTNNAGASISGRGGISGINSVNVSNSGSIVGSGSGSISSRGSITVINNAGGSITGTPDAISAFGVGGGSTVFNAGTISGVTAISFAGTGNTLTLAPGSVISGTVLGTGSDTFQLGGAGAATFDISQLGPAAQYQGFGTFNKIGSSTWTLTGTNALAWTVQQGTLNVAGTIGAAMVNTGTLTGTGTVGDTQINVGSSFVPGNGTPGSSMTVSGNLALQAGAVYVVQVNPATASFTNVTGTATLGGATVYAIFVNGSYISKQYTILTASSVNVPFTVLTNTNLPANFRDTLSYDATHAYLNLGLNFTPSGRPGTNFGNGLSGNQAALGNALINYFNTTGGIPMVYSTLTPAGLTQASGETATGSQQTTFNAMTQFMGVMTDPFVAGRGDPISGGGGVTGYADGGTLGYAAKRNPNDALAAIYTKAPAAAPFEQRWSTWVAGFGGSQNTDGNAVLGSNNTTSSVAGTAVGADYRFSPNTVAGFALAGGGTSFSVTGSGSGRSDLFQAGAFVRHNVGPAYISAALAYGWQDVTTNRTVTVAGTDQLRAEFNANAFSGRLEGGYRFVTPFAAGVGITPYAAGQFTTFDLPSYAESVLSGSSAFALSYGSQSVTDSRSELGVRADKSFAMSGYLVTLRGRVAWAHDYSPDRGIGATFQTLPGASFIVNGAQQASDSALTTAAIDWKWLNGWSASATFEGEFSNVTESYAGKSVVRYQW